jgi:hypothetical protein
MQRRLSAKLALWAAVGVGFCGVARSASAITYNRTAAVAYANATWNKVVDDGYFWINGSTAKFYGAGQPVPVNEQGEAGGIGDDCAHYVSSVLGTPGGGLTIPNRAGTYGEPGAAALDELLVGTSSRYGATYKYGELVSSISQLTPGDVIGYDWNGSGGGSMGGIDHTVVYVGNNKVNSHATSHLGANWTLGGAANYFFIHITLPDSIVPDAPSNMSPAPNASITELTPTLTANAFSDGAIGSTHVAAQWQIYSNRTLVYDSGTDRRNLTSLPVPAGTLAAGTSYRWQVRYQDNYGDWSNFSALTQLSIIAPLEGDYDKDGVVDTADYVLWRKNPANNGGAEGFNTWRAHFGMTTGGGGGSAAMSTPVPEPATVLHIILWAGIVAAGRRSISRCRRVAGW